MQSLKSYKSKVARIEDAEVAVLWAEFREELARVDRAGVVALLEASHAQQTGGPRRAMASMRLVLDYFCILWDFGLQTGYSQRQSDALLEVGAGFLKTVVASDKPLRRAVDELSAQILRFSVHSPPASFEVFSLPEMKALFALFAHRVLPHFDLYVAVLRSKKLLELRLFELFPRALPLDLDLALAASISDPLALPALRQFLLPPGAVYFTDAETRAILAEGRLDQLGPKEQEFILERQAQLEREDAINRVMDKQLGKLKGELQAGLGKIREELSEELR